MDAPVPCRYWHLRRGPAREASRRLYDAWLAENSGAGQMIPAHPKWTRALDTVATHGDVTEVKGEYGAMLGKSGRYVFFRDEITRRVALLCALAGWAGKPKCLTASIGDEGFVTLTTRSGRSAVVAEATAEAFTDAVHSLLGRRTDVI